MDGPRLGISQKGHSGVAVGSSGNGGALCLPSPQCLGNGSRGWALCHPSIAPHPRPFQRDRAGDFMLITRLQLQGPRQWLRQTYLTLHLFGASRAYICAAK